MKWASVSCTRRVCRLGLVLFTLSAAIAVGLAAEEMRTWTDNTGTHKIKGKFLRLDGGKVVMEREDGRKSQIDLKKLSEEDQKYVAEHSKSDGGSPFESVPDEKPAKKKKARPSQEEPAAGNAGGGAVEADWSGAKEVDVNPELETWKFKVEPAEETEAPKRGRPIALPAKLDFFEKEKGMVINPVCRRAVLAYGMDGRPRGPRGLAVGESGQTRLVICDLEKGRSISVPPVAGQMEVVALHDNGIQVLMRSEGFGFGKHDRLELWSITRTGVTKDLVWYPYGDLQGGERDVKWAAFLDGERLATLGASGKLAVWKIDGAKVEYFLQTKGDAVPALSPDRKYLAYTNGKQIGILDTKAGKILATQGCGHMAFPAFAFSPQGTRLACAAFDRVFVWDFATGVQYREILLTGWNVQGTILWTSEQHLLVGNRYLLDLETQVKLWTYEGQHATAVLGGICWFEAPAGHNSPGALVPAQVPHPGAETQLKKAMADPNFVVLKPGVTVRVVADGLPDPGQREKVKAILEGKLQQFGFNAGPNGTVDLVATIEAGKEQDVSYHMFGSPGTRSFKVHPQIAKVMFQAGGQTLWQSSASSIPFMVRLKEGETMEQHLKQCELPNYGWFEHAQLPKFLTRSAPGQTLGKSRVTASGLQ